MKTISILGCGWLGLPLAIYLRDKGFDLKGSSTRLEKLDEIKSNGISPFHIFLNPSLKNYNEIKDFFNTDLLIINFPPERREDIEIYHKQQLKNLIKIIEENKINKIIFVSSTSVYPEINRVVTEEDDLIPSKSSGKVLKIVEKMLTGSVKFKTTIIRFAGLFGYDRNPRNFLKKRRMVKNGDTPVNLIHRDDCINIIYEIIRQDVWDEIFNGCTDFHPTRMEFYEREADIGKYEITNIKQDIDSGFKIVSNEKLKKRLDYEFLYPDPLNIDH